MSSPRLTNKHAEEILNMSCMPVLGQPHIQVDINPTTEIARINIFAKTAKKYLMGKRAYNTGLSGRLQYVPFCAILGAQRPAQKGAYCRLSAAAPG